MIAWADPTTGEIHDKPTPGMVEIEIDGPGPLEHVEDDDTWLPSWRLRRAAERGARLSALKAAHAEQLARIAAEERAEEWRWGSRTRDQVRKDLGDGKRKSIGYAYGKAGWTSSKKTVVRDADVTIEWAREHAPEAIKVTESLLKSALPSGAPGVELIEAEVFWLRPAKGDK